MMRLLISVAIISLAIIYLPISTISSANELCPNVVNYYRETSAPTITVMDFKISPDGKTLLLSSPVGLYLYDAKSLSYIDTIRCNDDNTKSYYRFAWSPDNLQFALYYSTCVGIQIRDLLNRTVQKTLSFPNDDPYCADPFPEEPYTGIGLVNNLLWSPNGQYLAAIGNEPMPLRVWDLKTNTALLVDPPVFSGRQPNLQPAPIAWSPDGTQLVYAHDCRVDQWNNVSKAFTLQFDLPCENTDVSYYRISWSTKNRIAIAKGHDPLFIWDMDGKRLLPLTPNEEISSITNVAWSPDGTILAAVTPPETGKPGTNNITFLDTNGKILSQITSNPERIEEIEWHPDGKHLYILSEDNVLSRQFRLYDVTSRKVIAFLNSCVTWHNENPAFDCENYTGNS